MATTQTTSQTPANPNVNPTVPGQGQGIFPQFGNPFGNPAGGQFGAFNPAAGLGGNFYSGIGGQVGAVLAGVQPVGDKELEAARDGMGDDLATMTLDDFSQAASGEDVDLVFQTSMSLFAFAGFSPYDVFDTLKLYAAFAKIDAATFTRDVIDLIAYYMRRGTTIQRRGIVNSTSTDAQTRITALINRYRIQDNVYTNSKGPRIVTLARIMNTFPEVVGQKLSKQLTQPIGQQGLVPLCLSFAGGAALIPSSPAWNPLFEKFLDWAVSFDKVVNRLRRQTQNLSFDEKVSRENQRMWADLARSNSRHSDEFRTKFILDWTWDFELGLTVEDDKVTAFDWASMEPLSVLNPHLVKQSAKQEEKASTSSAPPETPKGKGLEEKKTPPKTKGDGSKRGK